MFILVELFSTKTISGSAKKYIDRLFKVKESFGPFNQKFDIFNRSVWDDKVDPKNFFISYDITNYAPKKSKGFNHWDYAMRNASWHLTDVVGEMKFETEGRVEGFTDYYSIQTQGSFEKIKLESSGDTTKRVKKVAKMFGAGDVGICEMDERWVYSHHFNRKTGESPELKLPDGLKYAVVFNYAHGLSIRQDISSGIKRDDHRPGLFVKLELRKLPGPIYCKSWV